VGRASTTPRSAPRAAARRWSHSPRGTIDRSIAAAASTRSERASSASRPRPRRTVGAERRRQPGGTGVRRADVIFVALPDTKQPASFKKEIEPLLGAGGVEFIGEINDQQKTQFLGDALALLFPIDWPEPFGLVMIEAMACGTPVIAYRGGAVPELVEQAQTGFVVESLEDAVEAVRHIAQLSRKRCREVFEQRFTATRMAHDYVQQFERLIAKNQEVSEAA